MSPQQCLAVGRWTAGLESRWSTEHRKRIERQDRVFIARLRAEVLSGIEKPTGVLGQEYGL